MAERLSFDTTFLIDLQKEKREGHEGRAHAFLKDRARAGIFLSSVVVGEFAEGFASPYDPALRRIVTGVAILDIDPEVSLIYAENTRRLRLAGRLIGSNDLWIGCCALRNQMPLVTRNGDHFKRLKGLQIIEY
ncbi:MAG: type II toxin-antitoxin system VapC family toxin [Acidobacteriota bacterium]